MERRAKTRGHEQEQPKEPTEAQVLTAKIDGFLTVAKTAKKAAKVYINSEGITGKEKKFIRREITDGFTELYFIREQGLPEELFEEKWGDKASISQELVDKETLLLREKIAQQKEDAGKLNAFKRTKRMIKASQRLISLTKEQRQSLFEITGYTKEESKSINIKLIKSFVGSLTTGVGLSNISIAAVTAHETVNPSLDYGLITDPKMAIALGLSYIAQYSSSGLASYTHRRLLEQPAINNCPNALATGLYFLVDKLNPGSQKATRRAVTIGTVFPGTLQEPFVLPTALGLPFAGIVRNTGATLANLTVAGGNVIYEIGTNVRNKRKDKITKE